MLRALQTNALSDKVAKVFEVLTPKINSQSQPALIEVKRPSNDRPEISASSVPAARRVRRSRRKSFATTSGSIRTSWF